jgi:CO dehydrogenase/acetyl-CoA synthase beta subunit
MENGIIIKKIRNFLQKEKNNGKTLFIYSFSSDPVNSVQNSKINIGFNGYKEIILEEETGLELGGINKKSFSIVFPISDEGLVEDGKIRLLGQEINEIVDKNIDFGVMILLEINRVKDEDIESLRHMSYVSNGIEGFAIRTIPRKFWCRISKSALQKGFSFEFLGNAIIHLYKQKFRDLIRSVEIIFINSYPSSIDEFIVLSSEILTKAKEKWQRKIEEWRKRIDCDYDWGCEICPYQEECYDVKQVLVSREEIKE